MLDLTTRLVLLSVMMMVMISVLEKSKFVSVAFACWVMLGFHTAGATTTPTPTTSSTVTQGPSHPPVPSLPNPIHNCSMPHISLPSPRMNCMCPLLFISHVHNMDAH